MMSSANGVLPALSGNSSSVAFQVASKLNGTSSTVFFSSPVTLMTAYWIWPGVLIVCCVVAAIPFSGSAVLLRLV